MSEIQQNIWFHVTSTNANKSCTGHFMTEMKKLNLAIFEAYKYLRPPLALGILKNVGDVLEALPCRCSITL